MSVPIMYLCTYYAAGSICKESVYVKMVRDIGPVVQHIMAHAVAMNCYISYWP